MATNGSARLTRTYTDEQRQAVLEAHLVEGLSMAETERRAIAGTLRPDLGPFGRPRFIYTVISKGRERYEAENETALDSGAGAELRRLTRLALAKARELGPDSDPAEIARRAKALADTHRALRGAGTKPKARASDREPENHDAEPATPEQNTLTSLLTAAKAKPRAKPRENAPKPVVSLAR